MRAAPPPAFFVALPLCALMGCVPLTLGDAAGVEPTGGEVLRPALVLARGAIAQQQLVAIRRDLVLEGESFSSAVVLQGSARIAGRVHGDVIVLGGDARLLPGAVVGGNVHVLGGVIEVQSGASVAGAQVAYPTAPRTLLLLLEGPSLGLAATSKTVIGIKLALAAAWLLVALLFHLTSSERLLRSAALASAEPFRCFFAGLAALLAGVCTIVVLAGILAPAAGLPLLAVALVFALLLKLWGTVAVFMSAGGWLLGLRGRARLPRRRDTLAALVLGALVLSLIKLVPALGLWLWTVVTLIGVGVALRSKFGLAEPWLLARHAP